MRKIFLSVLLFICVTAVPAMAAVQNVQVSGNLNSYYLFRENFPIQSP